MKKSLVLALVAVLVLSFASMAFAFTDTTNHWANAYINKLVDAKVVSGTTATTYAPDDKVTRAEFAKLIVGAKGLALENPTTATFSDVATTAWYFPYVEAAAKAKLIDGVGAGKFDPTALITREQVAKIVVLAAGLKADDSKAINFDDKASISDWAKGFVAVAADAKLVTGYNNKFSPKSNATRAEAAKLTYEEMLYEGKITAIADVAITGNVVSDNYTDGDTSIEIGGTLYDLASGAIFKLAGEYVTGLDRELFIKGTPVTLTLDNSDDIVIIDGTPAKVVEGKLESKGANADGKTVTVDGKDYVYVGSDDRKGVITYTNIAINTSYKFFLNKDGKVFGAILGDATRNTGKITSYGVKRVDSDYQYYIAIDSKIYNLEKASTDAAAKAKATVSVNGDATKTWDELDTDQAATITLDGAGYVTVINAFEVEQSNYTDTANYSNKYATFTEVDGDVVYLKNLILVGTAIVGEKTTESDAKSKGPLLNVANQEVLLLSSNATIKQDGTIVDWDKIDDNIYATITVNGEGVVSAVDAKDTSVEGQISALTMDDSDHLTSVTIAGTKYNFDSDFTDTAKAHNASDEYQIAKTVIKLSLNTKGEVIDFTFASLTNDGDEVDTYTVIATPFQKGRPIGAGVDDTYAAGGTVRVMDADGALFIVTVKDKNALPVAVDAELIKAGSSISLGDIKVGDTIAVDKALTEDDKAPVDWLVVSPATDIK